MAWVIYHKFKEKLLTLDNSIDFNDNSSTTVKVAFTTSSHNPATNVATDDFWNDVSASEVSGSGYSAGGNAVGTKTVTASSGTITFDAADPSTWSQNASGFNNAKNAILYKDTSSAATSPLIAYNIFSTNKGNVSGDLTIQFSASNGIFTIA